ncbi:MAG: YggS family pyridoxal phosphate-dependent enzyme [Deltaproteobacteria bacterium]|nr:YggS family pyridoxal phosphate-dependent enzyme [Deltaproteobacteria bacterium]
MIEATIGQALGAVKERIARAAERAGRRPQDVLLVAVSKTKSAAAVREAYEAGQRDFGENYVQELAGKASSLSDLPDLRWHMIGHLQTNKAKQVLKIAHMVQTVDSVRLAAELGARAQQAGKRLPVLLEVNVGAEEQKSGVSLHQARDLMEAVGQQEALELRGLMTVPPFELDAEQTAPYFRRMAELREELGGALLLPELSMGMSHDFEVAIEHGATMVRVGTLVFGSRT